MAHSDIKNKWLPTIETAIYGKDMRGAIHDSIEALYEGNVELAKDVAANQTAIDTLESDVSANQTDIATLESNVSTNANSIIDLNSGLSTVIANVSANQNAIAALKSDVADNTEGIATNANSIIELNSGLSTVIADVSANQNAIKNKADKVTEGGFTAGGAVSHAEGSITIGSGAETAANSVAIGYGAKTTASETVQLGEGANNTAKTFQVFDYRLLDSDGKIPEERLPDIQAAECIQADEWIDISTWGDVSGFVSIDDDVGYFVLNNDTDEDLTEFQANDESVYSASATIEAGKKYLCTLETQVITGAEPSNGSINVVMDITQPIEISSDGTISVCGQRIDSHPETDFKAQLEPTAYTLEWGKTFTAIDEVTYDEYGHVTSAFPAYYTLPELGNQIMPYLVPVSYTSGVIANIGTVVYNLEYYYYNDTENSVDTFKGDNTWLVYTDDSSANTIPAGAAAVITFTDTVDGNGDGSTYIANVRILDDSDGILEYRGDDIGTMADLETDAKDTLVAAINELAVKIDALQTTVDNLEARLTAVEDAIASGTTASGIAYSNLVVSEEEPEEDADNWGQITTSDEAE